VSQDDEPSPEAPYIITVTWAVGDTVLVDYPDLNPWEARVALKQALGQLRLDAAADEEPAEEEEQ
jgi:hypothetical protein